MNDREAVIKAAIEGVSLKAIGRKFDCTVEEVCLILDEFAATSLKPAAPTPSRVRGGAAGSFASCLC
jgi:hypothetical protein